MQASVLSNPNIIISLEEIQLPHYFFKTKMHFVSEGIMQPGPVVTAVFQLLQKIISLGKSGEFFSALSNPGALSWLRKRSSLTTA